MPRHHERKLLPYTPDQMYRLVADVEQYPEFLPWCTAARIRKDEKTVSADGDPCSLQTIDLAIRFKMFRETFRTRDLMNPVKREISIEYLGGPFKHLENRWHFEEEGEGVMVDFFIDFEFRSKALQALIGPLFSHAVDRLIDAFEARAALTCGQTCVK